MPKRSSTILVVGLPFVVAVVLRPGSTASISKTSPGRPPCRYAHGPRRWCDTPAPWPPSAKAPRLAKDPEKDLPGAARCTALGTRRKPARHPYDAEHPGWLRRYLLRNQPGCRLRRKYKPESEEPRSNSSRLRTLATNHPRQRSAGMREQSPYHHLAEWCSATSELESVLASVLPLIRSSTSAPSRTSRSSKASAMRTIASECCWIMPLATE